MPKLKRSYDAHATRERILDAAMQLFQHDGYNATSMMQLLEAAAVPAGSMYHCFPTKKALGLAVIEERVVEAVRETWLAPVHAARTPEAGILGVFTTVADELERKKSVLGCPVTNLAAELASTDADFRRALDRTYRCWEDGLRESLAGSANAGTRKDAALLANLVVASFAGAMSIAKSANDARALRDCAQMLRRLLRPRA